MAPSLQAFVLEFLAPPHPDASGHADVARLAPHVLCIALVSAACCRRGCRWLSLTSRSFRCMH